MSVPTNPGRINGAPEPFKVEMAARMQRLPPYLFGRINAMLYQKRRAGDDVIDLGMGNPSEPPTELVIEKLVEAARDPRNHGYSQSLGIIASLACGSIQNAKWSCAWARKRASATCAWR
jgi:hypothetical protein